MSYRDSDQFNRRWQDPEWRNISAGEYVLGTLSGYELKEFGEQLKRDPTLQQLVTQWEERLQPIADAIEPVEAPSYVWRRVVNTIAADNSHRSARIKDELQQARRKRSRQYTKQLTVWRSATGVACAAFFGALTMLWLQYNTPPAAFDAISVVTNEDGPLWVVDASVDDKVLRITALAPPPIDNNQVHQLWMVKPDNGGVVSLGLLPQDGKTSITIDRAAIAPDAIALAVSLEASGGSPEATPAGPVLYQGEFLTVNATGK